MARYLQHHLRGVSHHQWCACLLHYGCLSFERMDCIWKNLVHTKSFITYLRVITNICCFCRIFIGFQWVLISLQFIAAYAIPDVPEVVEIQLERTEFINSKVVLKVADEEFDEEEPEPESPRQAEATDEDPLTSEPLKTGCCGRTLKPKKVKKLKGAAQLEPITTFEYPTSKGSSWPEMMSNPAALGRRGS